MISEQLKIKLGHINGLQSVVINELRGYQNVHPTSYTPEAVYVNFIDDFKVLCGLRSVARVYLVMVDEKYNPSYIANHKSILGSLITRVLDERFTTFKISCAGAQTPEVRAIAEYIIATYKLAEAEDADLKIHIAKEKSWEIGVQITPRPLSLRDYKVNNVSGAMDPTIAYALNSSCRLEDAHTYLNAFAGSATLAIEAALAYPNLDKIVGFDIDKKHISLAIANIKTAGLIRKIQLFEKNVFDKPKLGMFDVIVADLPFGMVISKGHDLELLYKSFIDYSETILNQGGRLAVFTSEIECIQRVISKSRFKVLTNFNVQFTTSIGAHLKAGIIVCTRT